MMNKQENLQYLSPYPPYELQVMFGDVYDADKDEIKTLTPENILHVADNMPVTQPILRPITHVIEEIEHGGEKFTPVIEFTKIMSQKGYHVPGKIYIENNTAIIKFADNPHPTMGVLADSYFEMDLEPENITFSLNNEYKIGERKGQDEYFHCGYEFKMYQKLYEWHFDVSGLIERNAALVKDK